MKPFDTTAPDYHDFKLIKKAFRDAGFYVNYKEVGCGVSSLTGRGRAQYHAVFFILDDKEDNEVQKLIKEWERTLDDC